VRGHEAQRLVGAGREQRAELAVGREAVDERLRGHEAAGEGDVQAARVRLTAQLDLSGGDYFLSSHFTSRKNYPA